jgi:hypothetical protein
VATISEERVSPLLTTAWGQEETVDGECCYNYFTPHNYPCGCAATAMAQLMRYHRYPVVPVGARQFEMVVENDSEPYHILYKPTH